MVKGFDLWTEQLLLQVLRCASENEHVVMDYEEEEVVCLLGNGDRFASVLQNQLHVYIRWSVCSSGTVQDWEQQLGQRLRENLKSSECEHHKMILVFPA